MADDRKAALHASRLRNTICVRRASLEATTLVQAQAALAESLMPLLADATRVSAYLAIRGEAPLGTVLHALRASGTLTAVPLVVGDTLVFHAIDEHTPMRAGSFGIAEPAFAADADALDPMTFDAMLIPLVAFDADCNRVGMGAGFFDRCLEPVASRRRAGMATPRLIGIAHAFQQVDALTPQPWDVPLDMVVTEAGVVRPSRS